MTITQANYLDLAGLLIWEVFGSPILFMIVACIFVTWLGVKYALPLEVILSFIVLVIAATIGYAYNAFAWSLLIIFVAFGIYSLYVKIFRR